MAWFPDQVPLQPLRVSYASLRLTLRVSPQESLELMRGLRVYGSKPLGPSSTPAAPKRTFYPADDTIIIHLCATAPPTRPSALNGITRVLPASPCLPAQRTPPFLSVQVRRIQKAVPFRSVLAVFARRNPHSLLAPIFDPLFPKGNSNQFKPIQGCQLIVIAFRGHLGYRLLAIAYSGPSPAEVVETCGNVQKLVETYGSKIQLPNTINHLSGIARAAADLSAIA
jgi:hypothetical protein